MIQAIYWNTSALLKLYAPERDSSAYRQLLISRPEMIALSDLHLVKMYYALAAKQLRGEIVNGAASRLYASFGQHLKDGRFLRVELKTDVLSLSHDLLEDCLAAKPPMSLRSLDGIHLAAMRHSGISAMVTADLRMHQAARLLGLHTIDP